MRERPPEPPADDPIDALRRAWRCLQPRPSAPPTRQLDEADAATRAAVDWLRQAWRHVEVPAPLRTRRARLRPARARVATVATVAAAVVLAVGGAALLVEVARAPTTSVATSARSTAETSAEPTAVPVRARSILDPRPRVLVTAADRVEMRAGNVRLILLYPPKPTESAEEHR